MTDVVVGYISATDFYDSFWHLLFSLLLLVHRLFLPTDVALITIPLSCGTREQQSRIG